MPRTPCALHLLLGAPPAPISKRASSYLRLPRAPPPRAWPAIPERTLAENGPTRRCSRRACSVKPSKRRLPRPGSWRCCPAKSSGRSPRCRTSPLRWPPRWPKLNHCTSLNILSATAIKPKENEQNQAAQAHALALPPLVAPARSKPSRNRSNAPSPTTYSSIEIGRASCRERV